MRVGREYQAVVPNLETGPGNVTCCCTAAPCYHFSHLSMAGDVTGVTPGSVLVWVPTERLSEEDCEFCVAAVYAHHSLGPLPPSSPLCSWVPPSLITIVSLGPLPPSSPLYHWVPSLITIVSLGPLPPSSPLYHWVPSLPHHHCITGSFLTTIGPLLPSVDAYLQIAKEQFGYGTEQVSHRKGEEAC